jgi:HTH-type transcriptional regulator/antitoxin HigA
MDIRPLHTEQDYRHALTVISAPADADPEVGTPDGDRLDVLSVWSNVTRHSNSR